MQKVQYGRFWKRIRRLKLQSIFTGDGVNADTHLVTEVNGKPTAKIMYFNGLSRTRTNGDIAYLYNPYIQDNLAFFADADCIGTVLPGIARHIYLKATVIIFICCQSLC